MVYRIASQNQTNFAHICDIPWKVKEDQGKEKLGGRIGRLDGTDEQGNFLYKNQEDNWEIINKDDLRFCDGVPDELCPCDIPWQG